MTYDPSPRSKPEPDFRQVGRWGPDRRLEFIDWRLHWDGRLNRGDLTAFFGISVPQASLDLARYLSLMPANAVYDRSARVYVRGKDFVSLFPANGSARYLNELLAHASSVLPAEMSFLGWVPPAGLVPSPGRAVPIEVLLPVLTALRERRELLVTYQSMASPEPGQRRLSPHAVAFDGFRWHLRAWCHRRKAFRDFVLARVLKATVDEAATIDADQDEAWQRVVRLVLGPNPALSPGAQRVIELDYGMTDGRVELSARQALLFYGLKRLGLLPGQVVPPEVQQLALVNRTEIEPWLPAVSSEN